MRICIHVLYLYNEYNSIKINDFRSLFGIYRILKLLEVSRFMRVFYPMKFVKN